MAGYTIEKMRYINTENKLGYPTLALKSLGDLRNLGVPDGTGEPGERLNEFICSSSPFQLKLSNSLEEKLSCKLWAK